MIRVAVLVCAFALAACAAKEVPVELRQCGPAVAVPAPLPTVRTPAQIGHFAVEVELAREAERARADDCAERLRELNTWIGTR